MFLNSRFSNGVKISVSESSFFGFGSPAVVLRGFVLSLSNGSVEFSFSNGVKMFVYKYSLVAIGPPVVALNPNIVQGRLP